MANDGREPAKETDSGPDRRRLLGYGGLALLAGLGGIGAGLDLLDRGDGGDGPETEATPTPTPEPDATLALVERFAPDLYFGRRERWFPTDPRPYASERDGRTVVDGFDALAGYSREFRTSGAPPRPTVFYHVAPVEGSVVALQYWMYSVFDQFSVNFHWHDWELLQAFVDVETAEPLLLSASAHARNCPNNEFVDPDLGSSGRPVVLSEVGSHSSAIDVNENVPSFERLPAGDLVADVSNGFLGPLDGLLEQPFAYGLPRDEGARLPYAVPELDGVPLPTHPDLPDVGPEDFVAEDVTVRGWRDLARPPSGIPTREPGLALVPEGSDAAGDGTYELRPLADVAGTIDDFTGPQLSFEFAIPGFVEERFADHVTTAGIPWEDPRHSDPASDITDAGHRRTVIGDEPDGLTDRVVGAVSWLVGSPDGDVDAVGPDERDGLSDVVSVSLFPLPIEVVCLLRSDPVATPTAGGVFRFLNVDRGTHEFVVNGPGFAPYAERFEHGGGTVRPGADGRIAVVADEDAAMLRADRRDGTGIRRVRIVETYVGPVYDARPFEEDRFAIPVHREGDYTVEITDRDGVRGAVRVDPAALQGEPIPTIDTGKAALARALAEFLGDAASVARDLDGGETVPAEFDVAAREASRAAELAAEGDGGAANELLVAVVDRLLRIRSVLAGEHSYTDAAAAALRHRASDGIDRAEVAYGTTAG